MTSKRLHMVFIATIGLFMLGLIAGTVATQSMLSKEADTLVGLKAKSQALAQEQTNLRTAKQSITKYTELEKIAKAIVPEDKNQAATVREIVNIASANNIALGSITFPASTLGNLPGGAAGGSGAATATPAPAAGGNKAGSLSQLQPVKSIPGVYQLTITVTGDTQKPVRYNEFITFLSALERNRRTAQVTSVTLQPDTNSRNLLTFTLTLNQYIKP